MTNTYKPLSVRAKALYGDDVFEGNFTAGEERDLIAGGHVSIEPRAYEVLTNNFAAGKQGDTVDLALVVENEAALISGGHIQRADKKPAPKKKG